MSIAQSNEPIPNLPLLRKILDHIDAHPEEWYQADWWNPTDCGTAFCVAGHAVAMTEGVVSPKDYPHAIEPASGRDWETAAREHLGITADEACLFDEWNDRDMVQGYAEAIAARAGEVL